MRTTLRSLIHGFESGIQSQAARQVEMDVCPMGGGRYGSRIELKLPGQWGPRMPADHSGGTCRATRHVVPKPDG